MAGRLLSSWCRPSVRVRRCKRSRSSIPKKNCTCPPPISVLRTSLNSSHTMPLTCKTLSLRMTRQPQPRVWADNKSHLFGRIALGHRYVVDHSAARTTHPRNKPHRHRQAPRHTASLRRKHVPARIAERMRHQDRNRQKHKEYRRHPMDPTSNQGHEARRMPPCNHQTHKSRPHHIRTWIDTHPLPAPYPGRSNCTLPPRWRQGPSAFRMPHNTPFAQASPYISMRHPHQTARYHRERTPRELSRTRGHLRL